VARIDRALEVEPRAGLALSAALDGGLVRVTATPSNVAAGEGEVRLQIALLEAMLAYSGENGIRFHPMVVRSLAGADNRGFVVDRASLAPVEHVFDLAKISADLKAYLDEYELKGRPTRFAFSRKPVQMDPAKLSVVAFLQEERGRRVLQSAFATLR
jgi:hypothetical protein